ncbi:hypothetical protein B0H67DRAFT_496833, partial [Lasiosphaeris hirsuta]
RLGSLRDRVNNIITLSFNLVTYMIIYNLASMTIIVFITILFLPTAYVATVIGS